MTRNVFATWGICSVLCVTAGCGGGADAPTEPIVNATPTPTPTPAPTPTPLPLSVIPSCRLAASRPDSFDCQKPSSRHVGAVNAAIDRVMAVRPDLFDFNDVNGGPRVLKLDAYMVAVVAALGESGVCGQVDPEGEIGVKADNNWSEQWIVASRAGWGQPTANWVIRKYVGACIPSTF